MKLFSRLILLYSRVCCLLPCRKDRAEFEQKMASELGRWDEFKRDESKKLQRERKLFENHAAAARARPDKQERDEIQVCNFCHYCTVCISFIKNEFLYLETCNVAECINITTNILIVFPFPILTLNY